MSVLAQKLLANRQTTVKTALCMVRIRPVRTVDMLQAGATQLLPALGVGPSEVRRIDKTKAAEKLMADPAALAKVMEFQATMLCAGIEAISDDGKEWTSVTVVPDGDGDADQDILPVSVWGAADQAALLAAIVLASGMKGAAADAVARFPNPTAG